MAKRFQPMKDFARAKKPKLDISIGRSARSESVGYHNNNESNKCPILAPKQQTSPGSLNALNFWDDDDDDVILLATQKAEAAAVRRTDIVATEITFSEFAPQVLGSTSTQQFFPPAAKSNKTDLDALFDDDDDFDFLAVAAVEKKNVFVEPAEPVPKKNTFEEPPAPSQQVMPSTSKQALNNVSTMEVQVLTQSSSAFCQTTQARRQLAQERQMKFLMERVDALKKENVKLQQDLGSSKERIEGKDGEANLLRDELRHLRHQLQASKMEKLMLAETAKKECKNKVAEVYKQVTVKDTALKLRDVEYSKLKMKHAVDTRNFEMSMCVEDNTDLFSVDSQARRNMLRLHNLSIDCPTSKCITNNSYFYEYNNEDSNGKKQRTLFQVELEKMVLSQAQLQSNTEAIKSITQRIVDSVCKVFQEFWSYAHSLEFSHNCALYPYHSYELQSDQSADMRECLTQSDALFAQESAISLRRYIATLAMICQQQGDIAKALLQHKHGEYWLLQIANDAIAKLGYSMDICEHFGVLEAAAALLNSLLDHADTAEASAVEMELLFDLLKQLVFTRPNPWVFSQISACMLACTKQAQLMPLMCVNSSRDCFLSDRVRSVYRFGPDSCLLQVYAGLLELAFFSETPLQLEHFKLLLSICANHVRFVYQCFTNPPDFILEMLPLTDDEEEDAGEEALTNGNSMQTATTLSLTSVTANYGSISNGSSSTLATNNVSEASTITEPCQTSKTRSCECYVKLCLSVVTLVFQMLHQWMLHDRKIDTSQVGEISQIAVQLLTLIFREYYLTCLFRDSEETTKHYLYLICNWWQENAELLCFQETHKRFLRHLQESHFMLKPLYQETNPSNPANDLLEWNRIVKNADANVQKYINSDDPFDCDALSEVNIRNFFNGLQTSEYNFD